MTTLTELDAMRMFGSPDYDPVIGALRPGELHAAMHAQWRWPAGIPARDVLVGALSWTTRGYGRKTTLKAPSSFFWNVS